jgi:ketosteroid isomerase-like protein
VETETVDQTRPEGTDEAELRRLNDEYVRAFLESDVEWYRQHLTDDFCCTLANGAMIGKHEFLTETAAGPGVAEFSIHDVVVRRFGDAALVHACTRYVTDGGSRGSTAYTDVYIRGPEGWRCVAAQLTRVAD